jgi:DNA polymerase I-like protein with 3'-5' exonuclease and polymerase domains
MRLLLDIETTLDHSKIWCVVTKDLDTNEVKVWKEANDLSEYIKAASLIVAHNGIAFDFHLLKKLWKCQITLKRVEDTLVLSRLLNPSLEGGHSLNNLGNLLGTQKIDYTKIWSWITGINLISDKKHIGYNGYYEGMEFDKPHIPLLHYYCIKDVEVLHKVYSYLKYELKRQDFSIKSQELEHEVQAIIAQQERNGFKFNEQSAMQLLAEFKTRLEAITVEMQSIFPAKVTTGRTHKTTGRPLSDIVEDFNPGSRKQIAERLIEKGWKPSKFTEKTNAPIVDETTLEGSDIPEAKAIAEYLMLQKRISQVESWIEAVQADGRVHGRVISNGTVTGRMTHIKPNMAQVPNSIAIYGPECRDLWTVEKGCKLVGIDASGLELRMLAHYMNDDEYTNEVVSGDIHTANQNAAGLETRNQAKTFIYAFLYGAGPAKIGSVVGGTSKEGQKLITNFLRNTPKLQRLRERVSEAFTARGVLLGLDGRKLLVRSEHSALNTLLQGAGAIAMKQALVLLHKDLTNRKIPFKLVANVHDEWQIEVPEQYAEQVGKSGVTAITKAGVEFKMNCPLTGEYKIGDTWKQTH